MNVIVKDVVGGVPHFQKTEEVSGHSFFNENRMVTRLRPSQQYQNRLLLCFIRIFQRTIQWLFPFEKSNFPGIVSALDPRAKPEFQTLSPDELLLYFQRFFNADQSSSPSLRRCVSDLHQQYTEINKLRPEGNDSKKAASHFHTKWIKRAQGLKIGEQSLIVAHDKSGDELFYLFSKKKEGTFLKVIGRGNSMVRLSGIQEVSVAGEAQIVATLDYGKIDSSLISELISHSPLGPKTIQDDSFEKLLEGRRIIEEDRIKHLATKTQSLFDTFWTAFQQVHLTDGRKEGEFLRTKPRLELYTLFSLLKEYRMGGDGSALQSQTLARMHRLCADSLLDGFRKGVISQGELDQLSKELLIVQKSIDASNQSLKTPLSSLPSISMASYQLNGLIALACPKVLSEPKIKPVDQPRHPVSEPPISQEGASLVRKEEKIDAALPIPERLKSLVEQGSAQDIVSGLYAIDFSPYKDVHNTELNKNSPWAHFSAQEAAVLMQHLHTLSQRLVEFSIKEKELPIDLYEVLIKMGYMTVFLQHHIVDRGVFTQESAIFVSKILDFGHKVSSRFHLDSNRYGHCIHAKNLQTNAQLHCFYWNMLGIRNKFSLNSNKEFDLSAPIERVKYLQLQVDLLTHLTPYHPHSKEYGSLSSMLHNWIAPLPLPLLAAYHAMGTMIGQHNGNSNKGNFRNTPEALQHDPETSLEEYERLILTEEVQAWRKKVEEEIAKPSKVHDKKNSWEWSEEDFVLNNSPFAGDVRQQQLKDLLRRQEEYLQRASQMGIKFTSHELTALLSLLRVEQPQKEVVAFLQSHATMLSNPAVRSFIQLVFFHPNLNGKFFSSLERTFFQLVPRFFAEKIQEYKQKAEQNPENIEIFLFFVQMSERLKEIYAVMPSESKEETLDPKQFFPITTHEIVEFLKDQLAKNSSLSSKVEILSLQLKILLSQPKVSQRDLCQIILDMQQLKKLTQKANSFDFRELFWLKGSYQNLMKESSHFLDKEHLQYVLDNFCKQQGLLLDASSWEGSFPHFENAQYRIDLANGTVSDRSSNASISLLPPSITANPHFREAFPDLIARETQARIQKLPDGTLLYAFEDLHKHPCRIEEKNGAYSFYRSLPHIANGELLQAVSLTKHNEFESLFSKQTEVSNKASQQLSFFQKLTHMRRGLEPQVLPSLLKERLFIHPKEPRKGYILSPGGEVQLELSLKPSAGGMKIEQIIDLRDGQRSSPMQLVSLQQVNHPALKALEQIEDPSHILIWGNKKGSIEKIELVRYGLQFAVKKGSLVCTDPRYLGYEARLSASVQERKGIAFSLLLEHPDRTKKKKLLIPPAEALTFGKSAPPPNYYGLAYFIWLTQMTFSLLFGMSLKRPIFSPHLHIAKNTNSFSFSCLDLTPHTEEFVYSPGKETHMRQEILVQAIKIDNTDLAHEVISSLEIAKDKKEVRSWLRFLAQLDNHGIGAAIGLRVAEKLFEVIENEKKYEEEFKALASLEKILLPAYLKILSIIPEPLRLSQSCFSRIAEDFKQEDPLYYQKHLAPFFLKKGDTFTLPVETAAGLQTALPPLVFSPIPPAATPPKIKKLEDLIHPQQPIQKESLSHPLHLNEKGTPLIFQPAQIAPYFKQENKELTKPEALLGKLVQPKLQELTTQKAEAKKKVEDLLSASTHPTDQLAIFAGQKRIASFADLLLALLQNDFDALQKQNRLPLGADLAKLRATLIRYFDLETQLHCVTRLQEEITSLVAERKKLDSTLWAVKSAALWEQLLYQREYSPEKYPQLLAFEALQFINFKNSGSTSQLRVLQQLLKDPATIVQAGTGTGKSSVISVLRGLMRADGNNLVTQKVLPHLFQETLTLLRDKLKETYKRKIYPFIFNLSVPVVDKEGNSFFEEVYHNLLETIKNKGCVLTDYKSFVLLEQKFLVLSKQIRADQTNQVTSPAIIVKHWFYLAKILHLLKNKEDLLMDEFDQPLSAIQRIQTQMREGETIDPWMVDDSLSLYDLLLQEKELLLLENLQGDLPEGTRQKCIENIARKIASQRAQGSATTELLYQYLIGNNEEVLAHISSWNDQQKDTLAFLKDQCSIYLPLTLARSSTSNYARSKDGKRISTCSNGEKRDAKFGNLTEEINYSIQDYLQKKIALPTLREWLLEAKKDWHANGEPAEKRFRELFPSHSLARIATLNSDDFEDQVADLLKVANQNPSIVRYFLRRHLSSLKTSGIVVSMNPQDSVAMSRVVSGISATIGSLGSLHSQFATDPAAGEKGQKEMIERLLKRSNGPPVRFSPLDPLSLLKQIKNPRLCALIDGCGAFRSIPHREVAKALLNANPTLKRVDFYDEEGKMDSVGDAHAPLDQKGFYFPQAQTRGSDQVLRPDGLALLMENEKGTLEDFIQEEGRMRHPHQRVLVALSSFAPDSVSSLDALIAHKKENEKARNAEDRYRAELQRINQMVRHAARENLFDQIELKNLETLLQNSQTDPAHLQNAMEPFLNRFADFESLFVQQGSQTSSAGSYFQKHAPLMRSNADPVQELEAVQKGLLAKCSALNISVPELHSYSPSALRPYLPKHVLPHQAAQQHEVQVELEQELQMEQQMEEQLELQTEKQTDKSKVGSYLPRKRSDGTTSPVMSLHPAFDPKIAFTKPYLPLDRKDPVHRRRAFDDRTTRIGAVRIDFQRKSLYSMSGFQISRVLVGDPLDDIEDSYTYRAPHQSGIDSSDYFMYDIRTDRIIHSLWDINFALQIPEFHLLIAQVKFLDGMTDGYKPEELAALSSWLRQKGAKEMLRFFTTQVLKNRPEQRFHHSQLWNLFQTL